MLSLYIIQVITRCVNLWYCHIFDSPGVQNITSKETYSANFHIMMEWFFFVIPNLIYSIIDIVIVDLAWVFLILNHKANCHRAITDTA